MEVICFICNRHRPKKRFSSLSFKSTLCILSTYTSVQWSPILYCSDHTELNTLIGCLHTSPSLDDLNLRISLLPILFFCSFLPPRTETMMTIKWRNALLSSFHPSFPYLHSLSIQQLSVDDLSESLFDDPLPWRADRLSVKSMEKESFDELQSVSWMFPGPIIHLGLRAMP